MGTKRDSNTSMNVTHIAAWHLCLALVGGLIQDRLVTWRHYGEHFKLLCLSTTKSWILEFVLPYYYDALGFSELGGESCSERVCVVVMCWCQCLDASPKAQYLCNNNILVFGGNVFTM